MAQNAANAYGLDIACPQDDADELWTEGQGVDIVAQDTYHVLTCTNFLGPNGDSRGRDVRTLVGKPIDEVLNMSSVLEDIVCQDDRIQTCTITFVETPAQFPGGPAGLDMTVEATTALGPFAFTKSINEIGDDFGLGAQAT